MVGWIELIRLDLRTSAISAKYALHTRNLDLPAIRVISDGNRRQERACGNPSQALALSRRADIVCIYRW